MNYGTYATLSQIRTDLAYGASDTSDDTALLDKLVDASRWVDQECRRHFFVVTATRVFTAQWRNRLRIDDLLAITTLKTDEDGDWDYDYTWAATDYHLYPFNAFPKTKIAVKSGGDYTFPSQEEGVQIAGQWGYGDETATATPTVDSTANTAEELDTSETGVDVSSGSVFSAGNTILVESEQVYVTAVSSNTLTVIRGVNGTTAATHATSKDVYLYQVPSAIKEATLIYARWLFAQKGAPLGTTGSSEVGSSTVRYADIIARRKIEPYRRLESA